MGLLNAGSCGCTTEPATPLVAAAGPAPGETPRPNRPGRDRQASPQWYSFAPPSGTFLPPPLTINRSASSNTKLKPK